MLTVPIIKSQPKTIQITYRKCTNQVYCYGYTLLVQCFWLQWELVTGALGRL